MVARRASPRLPIDYPSYAPPREPAPSCHAVGMSRMLLSLTVNRFRGPYRGDYGSFGAYWGVDMGSVLKMAGRPLYARVRPT